MRNIILILLIPFAGKSQSGSIHEIYTQYHLMPATEIVIDAFTTKDIVFIGEPHYIREHVNFIASLIEPLHKKGVNILFTEFARYDDSDLINTLITGENFDPELAKTITHRSNWYWGFQEYIDIYKKAWQVNKKSKGGKFRIIGLGNTKNYSVIQNKEDLDDWKKRRAYNGGSEEDWAKRIMKHAADSSQKAVVYCGSHHALTRYRQPYFEKGLFAGLVKLGDRVGQMVFEKLPERVMIFWLHRPLPGRSGYSAAHINPLNGLYDSLWYKTGKTAYGFYTAISPLGSIPDSSHVYSNGYPGFSLKDLADGYLVVGGSCKLVPVTIIPDFINETNLASTNTQYLTEAFSQFTNAIEANAMIHEYLSSSSEKLVEFKRAHCKSQ